MTIRVAHLYPEYLNIYADRGNIAVLSSRARWRGIGFEVEAVSLGDELRPGEHDLFYIGGGQDREQGLIAPDLAGRAEAIREAVGGGAAVLAVCGGYQLLGRFYRGRDGAELPGAGLFPLDTVAGERRMIGDCLLECELEPGVRRTLAGFENHAGVTRLDEGAEPLGRVVAGLRERRRKRLRGRPRRECDRHVSPRPPAAPQCVVGRLDPRARARASNRRATGARPAAGRARGQRPRRRSRASTYPRGALLVHARARGPPLTTRRFRCYL